jgi:hypothetical protein
MTKSFKPLMTCLIAWPPLCFISNMGHPLGSKLSHFQVLSKNSEHCRPRNSSIHSYFLQSAVPTFHPCTVQLWPLTCMCKWIHAGSWHSSTSECLYPLCKYTIQHAWSANVSRNSAWHSCAFLPQSTHIFTYEHCSMRWTSTSEQGCQHSDVWIKCLYTSVPHLLVKFMSLVTHSQTHVLHFPHCHIMH